MMEYYPREEVRVVDERAIAKMVTGVFLWMFAGIMATMGTVTSVMFSPDAMEMISRGFYAIIITQFLITLGLSFLFDKISSTVAKVLYFGYAVLTGLIFSLVALHFGFITVLFCLGLTATIFGVMAAYGYYTKEDLSRFGPLLMVGVLILIVASIANIFLQLPIFSLMIAYLGVIIFTALIGFDVNRIKANMIVLASQGADAEYVERYSIFGAFQIYLDFINLFWYLLRIFGSKN